MNFINYGKMTGNEAAKLFKKQANEFTESIEEQLNKKKKKQVKLFLMVMLIYHLKLVD